MRMGKLALHLQGRRGMFAHALLVMKLDRNLGFHLGHIGELQQEVALPAAPIVFAIGDDLEPEILLQADDVADRGFLNTLELGVWDRCLDAASRASIRLSGQIRLPTWCARGKGPEGKGMVISLGCEP